MRSIRNLTILLGLSAGITLLAPTQAEAASCTPTTATSGMFTIAQWQLAGADGITCVAGDKTYTFGASAFSGGYNPEDVVMVAENVSDPTLHTFNVTNALGHWGAGTLTANYKVEVTGSGESLSSWGSGATSSSGTASFVVDTTATSGGACNYNSGAIGSGGCINQAFAPVPGVTSSDFTNTIVSTGSGAVGPSQFTNSLRQTPGPLPILGAGAAFGFSRKLRSRIKASA